MESSLVVSSNHLLYLQEENELETKLIHIMRIPIALWMQER